MNSFSSVLISEPKNPFTSCPIFPKSPTIFVVPNVEAGVGVERVRWSGEVSHKSVLKCLFYNAATKHLVFESSGMSLQNYISNWSSKSKTNKIFGNCKIEAYDPQLYHPPVLHQSFLDPHIRPLFKGIYQCVHDLHLMGYSPLNLEMDGMRVFENVATNDVVVKILVRNFARWTPTNQHADFVAIRDIIKLVLPINQVLKHLFDLSDTWKCAVPEDGEIFTKHPSIITPSQLLLLIIRCGDWNNSKKNMSMSSSNNVNRLNHVKLLSKMIICTGWNSRFTKVENRWLNDKFLPKKGTFSGDDTDVRQSLITCARNIAAHYADYLTTREDIVLRTECAIMYLFGKEIFSLVESIGHCGELSTYLQD